MYDKRQEVSPVNTNIERSLAVMMHIVSWFSCSGMDNFKS